MKDQTTVDDLNLQEQKEKARLAMEGPERTAKRERQEKLYQLDAETSQAKKGLTEVQKQKEEMELAWIELDNQRKTIRQGLNPILEEEKAAEAEEAALETEEAKIGVAGEKHVVEEKRWQVQERRKAVEQKKWAEEEQLDKIEKTIEQNTTGYRALLDQEEKLQNRLEELGTEALTENHDSITPG